MPLSEQDRKDWKHIAWFFGIFVCFFYLIFTALTYFKFKKQFAIEYADARVQDPLNFTSFFGRFLIACGVASASFMFFCGLWMEDNSSLGLFEILIFTLLFLAIFVVASFFAIAYASRIATTQIGVLIYQRQNAFVIPCDVYNATLLEQLRLQWFNDMRNMEVLRLSDIMKITRGEHGKMLYIHGTFGTRGVLWRDKRKREECIYALQIACNRKLADNIAYD